MQHNEKMIVIRMLAFRCIWKAEWKRQVCSIPVNSEKKIMGGAYIEYCRSISHGSHVSSPVAIT